MQIFTSFNPTDMIDFNRETELGLSKLQNTIMKALKYKNHKTGDEDLDGLFD